MTTIAVLGGTGYASLAVVKEAVRRGHRVTSVSRNLPPSEWKGYRHSACC